MTEYQVKQSTTVDKINYPNKLRKTILRSRVLFNAKGHQQGWLKSQSNRINFETAKIQSVTYYLLAKITVKLLHGPDTTTCCDEQSVYNELLRNFADIIFIVLFCISGCCLSKGFCSVPGPNLSAAYFQTSEKSSRSIHTKTKLNRKNNITKHNFSPNVQISYSNRMKLAKST